MHFVRFSVLNASLLGKKWTSSNAACKHTSTLVCIRATDHSQTTMINHTVVANVNGLLHQISLYEHMTTMMMIHASVWMKLLNRNRPHLRYFDWIASLISADKNNNTWTKNTKKKTEQPFSTTCFIFSICNACGLLLLFSCLIKCSFHLHFGTIAHFFFVAK